MGGMNILPLVAMLIATGSIPPHCQPAPRKGYATAQEEAAPLARKLTVRYFSSKEFALCVVDEGAGRPEYGSLKTAMQRNGCVAGVNGGYFGADAQRTPLGLLRHGGRSITTLSTKGFAVSGVLYDTGRGIYLERSNALSHKVEDMQEAVQGGPFLVERGKTVPGLNAKRPARRTFIATDGKGNWCLGATAPMTLQELADLLATPGTLECFNVATALNLDGGTSTAMWDSASGRSIYNLKPVRNYVGILPRGGRSRK